MSGSSGNVYSPSGTQQSQQNANATSLLGQNSSALQNYSPTLTSQASGITNSYLNNPYQAAAQTGANTASSYGTGTVVPGQQAGAASLQNLGNQNAGYSAQALQTGFDPQNALYNTDYQQTTDQQNAINAQNGVAGTPYAAGVTGLVGNNFNLNWLNQALGRQQTAAGTASTLSNTANTDYTGASNLGQAGINTQASASALPATTYGTNLSNELAALSGQNTVTSGATGVDNSTIQSLLSYLGYGTSAGTAAANAQSNALSGIGSLLGATSNSGTSAGSDILSVLGL